MKTIAIVQLAGDVCVPGSPVEKFIFIRRFSALFVLIFLSAETKGRAARVILSAGFFRDRGSCSYTAQERLDGILYEFPVRQQSFRGGTLE